jgi:hypothetical protein
MAQMLGELTIDASIDGPPRLVGMNRKIDPHRRTVLRRRRQRRSCEGNDDSECDYGYERECD